jgi:hypothetical protein
MEINLKSIKKKYPSLFKAATRSWKEEYEGMLSLGSFTTVSSPNEVAFQAIKNAIDRNHYFLVNLTEEHRLKTASNGLFEAKLMFLIRYESIYKKKNTAPFKVKWIHDEYKTIVKDHFFMSRITNET